MSRTLVDKESVTLTLFAFKEYELQEGETIVMPADIPHVVEAVEKSRYS